MKKTGYAYFVESPRTIDDLMEPYPIEQETAYEIVKTVKLSGIDYENFITDMIADRQFIEDHAALCSQGETWRCILVQRRGHTGGVLVVPVDSCMLAGLQRFRIKHKGRSVMQKKTYPKAFKKEVVQFYERNHTIAETRAKYGISESTLFDWKRKYDEEHFLYVPGPGQKKRFRDAQAHIQKTEQELEVLARCSCGIYASIDDKIAAIEALEGEYSVHVLCEALHLSRGTYYNRKRRKGQLNTYEASDEELKPILEKLFHENMDLLGRKPMQKKLRDQGIYASEKRIARLMKELGLFVSKPKYQAEHKKPIPNPYFRNRLDQQYDQTAPNLVWVSDITYVKVGEKYYYVCVILDLFSRLVLSYGISDTIDTTMVVQTFLSAFSKRNRPADLLFHSDQGTQYTSFVFREILRDLHVKQSFSRPGVPYDNAVCESFFHTLKKEAIYHHLYETPEDLSATMDAYIAFYNERRPHRALNMLTPAEKEQEFAKMPK